MDNPSCFRIATFKFTVGHITKILTRVWVRTGKKDVGFIKPGILIRAGNFKNEIAVLVCGSADEQAPPVEQLDLGFKYGPRLLHHLQSDVGPAAVDALGRDRQSAVTGKGHHAGLAHAQVEAFAAEQSVGSIVEHGLQFTDVSFQFWIDHGVIARSKDGVHADPAAFLGQQGVGSNKPGERPYHKRQQTAKSIPHWVHFPRLFLQYTRGWFVAFREFRKS